MKSDLLALSTIMLWGSLAALSVSLAAVPPLLMTGLALLVGSLISLPLSRFRLSSWKVPLSTLAIGVYGLFGFHFFLFAALKIAPPAQANLVNYLWPVFIVALTPVFLRGFQLNRWHLVAVLLGFAGASIAILGGQSFADFGEFFQADASLGYLFALAAAVIWATYSLLTKRVAAFDTAAIGAFALVAGLLALASHFVFEPTSNLEGQDWLIIVLMGLGPLGGAFYLWDAALKLGDTRRLGILAFLTPLISTGLLLLTQGQPLTLSLATATALIIAAAAAGQVAAVRSKTILKSQEVGVPIA
jgi:drug/metabolite transporter (DMT)-like permease